MNWKVRQRGNGKFITLEGGEGAGKTTQIRLLARALKTAGVDSIKTREPGGAPEAELIRSLLVKGSIARWQPMTEALLLFSARLEHVNATIFPALEAGRWVISDRFSDSTVAYQGYGHGLGRDKMITLQRLVLGDLQPDLTIILDVPDEVGLARALKREDNKVVAEDRYERMGSDFHRRVKDGFLKIARFNPKRCAIIDADQSPEEVNRAILNLIKLRLGTALK